MSIATKTQWIDCPKCKDGWFGTWERSTKTVKCVHCGAEVKR